MFGSHRIYLVPIKTAELCSELQLAPSAHQLLDFKSSTTGLTETTCVRPAYEITRWMDDASAPCGDGWTEKLTNGCLKVRWMQCTWICEPPLHSSTGPGFKQISICQRWGKMVNVQSKETKIQHIILNPDWRKRVTLCLEPTTLNSRLEAGMVFDKWASITTPQAEIPFTSARLRDYAGKENHDLSCNMLWTERGTMSSHNSAQLDLDSSNLYWFP